MSTAIIIGVILLIGLLAAGIYTAQAMRRGEEKRPRPDGSGAGPDGDGADGGGDGGGD